MCLKKTNELFITKTEAKNMAFSIDEVYKASTILKNVVRNTDLIPTRKLNAACRIFLKPENLQVTGSFKVRGAGYKISQLSEEEKKHGVLACSAGNHAQGVALAAQKQGLKAVICMPAGAPISKVEATKALGAEVVLVEGGYDDAYKHALQLNEERGMTFIHPFDDEQVIAGQGTVGMEILNQYSDVDVIFVPIGGGGLASGLAYTIKTLHPTTRIIGVQAEGAASMVRSLEKSKIKALPTVLTIADGIAVREPGNFTFELCRTYVDDVVTVSEDEICAAILALLETHKLIAEGAGAVSVAAAMFNKADIAGKNVCCVVSGGNIDVTILSRVINRGLMKGGRTVQLLIEMHDHPGSLQRLCNVFVKQSANIIAIHHERNGESPDVNSCNLRVVLETRDFAHIAQITQDVEAAGYVILEQK